MSFVRRILLCPPDHFRISYEINPWMHIDCPVDHNLAMEQHASLLQIYKTLYDTVDIITQNNRLPDMVYAANFGFVIGQTFIRSNFRYPQRRGEAFLAEAYMREHGYDIVTLPDEVFFEGQGDMLYRDGVVYFGYGQRSSVSALPYLKQVLRCPIVSFHVDHPYYYHLDTCFAPIGNDSVVINKRSFSEDDLTIIKKKFSHVIQTSIKDNQVLCCNMVEKNDTVLVGKGVSNDFLEKMDKIRKKVIQVAMSEFLKGGGSVKCLTLEFYEE